jgi:hypothetical protein
MKFSRAQFNECHIRLPNTCIQNLNKIDSQPEVDGKYTNTHTHTHTYTHTHTHTHTHTYVNGSSL